MEEKNISPEESLQIIEKMLANTRTRFYYNGFSFLFWSALIILDCVITYCMNLAGYEAKTMYVWLTTIFISPVYAIVAFWYYSKIFPKKEKRSRFDYIHGMLWMSFGITCFVLFLICVMLKIYFMGSFTFCLLGLCMFVSGAIYKFRWLYVGAVIFWTGSIVSAWLGNSEINLLASAIVMFLGYTIPGYLLWRKAKQEAHV